MRPGSAEEIRELFVYMRWANLLVLEAASTLPLALVTRETGSSFSSILSTLAHMAWAEGVWVDRWVRGIEARAPAPYSPDDVETLRGIWDEIHRRTETYLGALTDTALESTIEYRNQQGHAFQSPLWKLMRHVVNHATHHRGQVITMLRQAGAAAPNTDLIRYYREHN